MKIWVYQTDEGIDSGKAEEFDSLDDCVESLLADESVWGAWQHELIVTVPRWRGYDPEPINECEYVVEIYNDWRENYKG